MLRVLHVDTGREWRGGQAQLLHLARAGGAEVALPPDAPVRAALEASGVEVHPIPLRGGLRGLRRLRALVRRLDPDLLAAHTSHAHTQALLAAQGRPVVVHRRVDFAVHGGPKYGLASGYIAVSAAVAAVLARAGVAPRRVAVVHDGVDPAAFPPAPRPGRGVIGALGALVPHKGHRHLVDAMARLPGASCVIAGEGPLHGALAAQIARLGLADQVRLVGQVRDVPAFFAGIDVLCHPSIEEGMGQAVVEAMLSGVPVVASRVGGLPEVVDGWLVPPADPEGLAVALAQALDRPRVADRAQVVARFGVERMIRETHAAYARFSGGT